MYCNRRGNIWHTYTYVTYRYLFDPFIIWIHYWLIKNRILFFIWSNYYLFIIKRPSWALDIIKFSNIKSIKVFIICVTSLSLQWWQLLISNNSKISLEQINDLFLGLFIQIENHDNARPVLVMNALNVGGRTLAPTLEIIAFIESSAR